MKNQLVIKEALMDLIAKALAIRFQEIVDTNKDATMRDLGERPNLDVAAVILVRGDGITRAAVNAENTWSDNDITDALNQVIGGLRAGKG